jgi:phasin family protein
MLQRKKALDINRSVPHLADYCSAAWTALRVPRRDGMKGCGDASDGSAPAVHGVATVLKMEAPMAKQNTAIPAFDTDFTKFFGDFKVPGIDVDLLVAAQRKNVEALTAANQLAFEGLQAASRRHIELMKNFTDEVGKLAREFTTVEGAPEEKFARQADLAKQAYEQSIASAKELSDILAKSTVEAADVINKRVTEGFGEMKSLVKKAK